ncbi:hypothetical protein Vretimale_10040 [Volvox reticuliferus]|uniref:Uncharacterized protein n=1 Tax=Volvox reticuliferus TaxID=1737510 RepID=A0A8J4BVI2_9CHLO|nr:hypothetical protein Vretifemale_802 [Volvox reticuliferus]GIM05577.1 hypothetical protein Vretimale_10040 [Volvox reticuliferus]
MDTISYARMSTRYRCSQPSRPERPVGSGQMVVTTRAVSSAVLTMPVNEGASRCTTTSRDNAEARTTACSCEQMLIPASSGLDFIDLVGLDESTVWNRLQDAVTYRVLVGCGPAKEFLRTATHIHSFNVKQLKSYRDNVTRNLAPTVARGFANAARGVGHVISAGPSTASPSASVLKPAQLAAAPPPPGLHSQLRPQQEDAAPAATPLSTPAQAPASSLPSTQQQDKAYSVSAAVVTPPPSNLTAGGRPAQRVSVISTASVTVLRGLPDQPIQRAVEPVDTTSLITIAAAAVRSSSGCQEAAETGAPVPNASSFKEASAGVGVGAGAGAVLAASMSMNEGRRRGSRGASRGRLLAVAGRHASGAGASAGPAWI